MDVRAEEEQRLDRLASEEKGGGGLALPSFFRAVMDELLDNGTASDERLAEVVAKVGADKTKRLAENWGGSWAFLTADLLETLACNDLVFKDGDRWHIGPGFTPGALNEAVPARKGRNTAQRFVSWEKEEREQLAHAASVKVEMEQRLRQPRGKVHSEKIIGELRASYEEQGPLAPVLYALIDGDKVIIDGRHRLQIDPDWPATLLEHITTKEQAINAILELDRFHKEGHERLSKDAADKLEALVGKALSQNEIKRVSVENELRADATRSNRAIAEAVGNNQVSYEYVRQVREKLIVTTVVTNRICDYVFPGSTKVGKHAVECWCGEGDYTGKPAKEKKPKGPTVDEQITTFLHGLVTSGYVHRKNKEGRKKLCAQLLSETGIKRSHGALEQRLDKLTTVSQPATTEPEREEKQPEHQHAYTYWIVPVCACGHELKLLPMLTEGETT